MSIKGIRITSLLAFTGFLLTALTATAFGNNPFSVSGNITVIPGEKPVLSLSFTVPEHHYLYADLLKIKTPDEVKLKPRDTPAVYRKHDPSNGTERDVYTNNFTITYSVTPMIQRPLELTVSYQGCSDQLCFFPVTTSLVLSLPGIAVPPLDLASRAEEIGEKKQAFPRQSPAPATQGSRRPIWQQLADGFRITGKNEGYIRSDAFIRFLDESGKGQGSGRDMIHDMFGKHGTWTWVAVLLIILGGLGLNLTPCVLPMIPINIAIIGAGAGAGSKAHGFALGGIYGGAIALTYGLLGLFVVLTGSMFGVLNSSYLFNAIIAIVFIVLSLAMFDLLTIDFSRFQQNIPASGNRNRRGSMFAAFFMGTVSALLAGACVAPVVVSVLLLSTDLYKNGNTIGLFLPFLLGLGMGLPWPFMGAGLSFLPKPGMWMERVKHIFGVVIIGFAIYYGHLAYRLFVDQKPENKARVESAQQESIKNGWLVSLPDALAEAKKRNKPVFIDFWASWCKNCLAMEETTFKDGAVRKKLDNFVRVKFRAEQPNDTETSQYMKYFNCFGLPTYVVLIPIQSDNKFSHE